jgi:hypothetical protein
MTGGYRNSETGILKTNPLKMKNQDWSGMSFGTKKYEKFARM